jgi:hypothetical protein
MCSRVTHALEQGLTGGISHLFDTLFFLQGLRAHIQAKAGRISTFQEDGD